MATKPRIKMIKAVPRSGCIATIKNNAIDINKGMIDLINPIVFGHLTYENI